MKWRCALLQRRLPEYLDGELPGFWRRLLKAHLEVCPQCHQELEALAQVVQALKAAPVADPGPEFWAEFNRELHLKLAQTAHAAAETTPAPAGRERRRTGPRERHGRECRPHPGSGSQPPFLRAVPQHPEGRRGR